MNNTSVHLTNIKIIGLLAVFFGCAFSVSACSIGLGIYVTGLFLQLFDKQVYDWRPYPKTILAVLFFVSLVMSLFISSHYWVSFRRFFKFVQCFILLYAVLDAVRDLRVLRYIFVAWIFCGAIAALAGIAQATIGHDFIYFRTSVGYPGEGIKIPGTYKHYNDFGTFLVPFFATIASLIMYFFKKRKMHYVGVGLVVFVIMSSALVLTQSRSALISCFFSLLVLSLFLKSRWKLILFFGVVFSLIWFIPSNLSTRLHELLDATTGTMPERLVLFKIAFSMLQDNWFFGLGLNTYSIHFLDYRPDHYSGFMYPHNTYIHMAAEMGLVGLTLYLMFIFSCLWTGVQRVIHHSRDTIEFYIVIAIISGLSGILLNGLFESIFQSTQLRTHFWVLVGVLMAVIQMIHNVNRKAAS